jgi:hypothetical protein
MAGSPFTYRAFDLLTWEELDSLPYAGVTFGRQLNAAGPFSGTLAITDPGLQQMNWQESTRTGRTGLFVDFQGALIWGGIIWTRSWDDTATPKVLNVSAMEFGSWFKQRLQAADYTTTFAAGADPMEIIYQVVYDAINLPPFGADIGGGGLQIALNPPGGSGQVVVMTYPATQLQTIDSIVSTLSQMGYMVGPDYSFDVAYIPNTNIPQVTLNIWYPRQGRPFAESEIVIMHASTCGFTYPEDSTKQADSVAETGSGTGGLYATVEVDEVITTDGYPLLEAVISRTQITTQAPLVGTAVADAALFCYPVTTPTLTLPLPLPDPNAFPDQPGFLNPAQLSLGQFDIGDDIMHIIAPAPVNAQGVAAYGMNNSPRFPEGLQFEWRITQWTCTVSDSGLSTILLDLGVPPQDSLPPPQPPLG